MHKVLKAFFMSLPENFSVHSETTQLRIFSFPLMVAAFQLAKMEL